MCMCMYMYIGIQIFTNYLPTYLLRGNMLYLLSRPREIEAIFCFGEERTTRRAIYLSITTYHYQEAGVGVDRWMDGWIDGL